MKPEDQTPVPSPCINVCQMAPETGLCIGCMRTIDEIIAWSSASDDYKRATGDINQPLNDFIGVRLNAM